jgi:hypothetical protein
MRVLKATHAPLSFDIVDNIVDKVHSPFAGTRSLEGQAAHFQRQCAVSVFVRARVHVLFDCCGPGTLRRCSQDNS